jgi:hypothetical protein
MPIAALALNNTWESTYVVRDLMSSISIQALVNIIWALAGPRNCLHRLQIRASRASTFRDQEYVCGVGMLIFAASYVLQWLFLAEFGAHAASRYSAFLTKHTQGGAVCPDDRCTARPSRAERMCCKGIQGV